jgi:xylulokinase
MPLVAGVDSSTSACKVEIRDADTGELVSAGRAGHPATTPPCSEQDPGAWARAFTDAWDAAGANGRYRPAAVAIAAQQHGLVVCDDAGGPLRPAKLWNDTQSDIDADALVEALGPQAWAQACGSVPVPSFTVTKLAWLRRCEPAVFAATRRIALPHDWLTWRLTHRWTTDRGDASGTGWWSPAQGRYRPDLLALVDPTRDLTGLLPEVLGPNDAAGEHDGMVVAAGTGDNMAAAVGLALRPGDLALSIGTSATAFTVSETPHNDPTGTVAGFADATGRYLPLVCTLNATKATDAVARLLAVDHDGFDALAVSAPPGADGVVLVPHLDGERTPNRPAATGTLVGMRSDISRSQLARAAVEGVVCNLLDGADRLGVDPHRIVLIGGGARSAAYREVVAQLTGVEVAVPTEGELVARGAAVQAAAVLTGSSVAEVAAAWPLAVTSTEPPATGDRHEVRARYTAASSGLAPTNGH